MIPYGRQNIDQSDVEAVAEVLKSDYLTTGPAVAAFEEALAQCAGAAHAAAVSSGTAALHCAMYALGIGPGDEVIVPPMTFAATANCVVYQGGTPVFADVDADTLLLSPEAVEKRITPRTRAVIAVDYAGQPCDYAALRALCSRHGLALVADSCHALGATRDGRRIGELADMAVFSFHPVKHVATGEGGAVVTNDEALDGRVRLFRNHGIDSDYRAREEQGSWAYAMVDLGFNYRITDIQCALGVSQLSRLPDFLAHRRALAAFYDARFAAHPGIAPLAVAPGAEHAYHLYVVRLSGVDRGEVFTAMRRSGVGVNVHYIPVHLHPYYRERYGLGPGLCPVAEAAYEGLLSLPMHQGVTEEDRLTVVRALEAAMEHGA